MSFVAPEEFCPMREYHLMMSLGLFHPSFADKFIKESLLYRQCCHKKYTERM